MARSALFLVNPKARRGRVSVDTFREVLTSGGLDLVDASVAQSRDLSALIRSHRDRVDMVIIGGGDGTLHHALEGLVETQLPVGIVPLGTANDFARTLKLPTDLFRACDVILQGNVAEIDLGQVNGKLFCNVASIGLPVQVTQHLKQNSKSRWGVLAYLFAALQSLRQSRSFVAEIVDGDDRQISARTIQVTVGNGRSYGGGLIVHESATADDGLLNLFSLEIDHWWHIVPLIPALRSGKLESTSQVRNLRGKHFDVRTPTRSQRLIADGEFVGFTPARISCHPRALRVFMPARAE